MAESAAATDIAPDGEAPAAPASKGKKKLLIALAVLLVGGGAGAYFMLAGGAKEGEAEAHEVKGPALYVELDPPFVVNFESSQQVRFLQVTLQLMSRDPALVELLKTHEPVIRNDLLLLYGSQTHESVSTREGKEQLREATLGAVRKIVAAEGGKPEALEAAYFTSFVMQ